MLEITEALCRGELEEVRGRSGGEGGAGVRGRHVQGGHVQGGHDLFYMLENHSGCWRKNGLGWMGQRWKQKDQLECPFANPAKGSQWLSLGQYRVGSQKWSSSVPLLIVEMSRAGGSDVRWERKRQECRFRVSGRLQLSFTEVTRAGESPRGLHWALLPRGMSSFSLASCVLS